MTSDNLDDILGVPAGTASLAAAAALRAANRHVHWIDMDHHGYGVLDVTPQQAQMDYYVLSDRTNPDSSDRWTRSYRTLNGTQRVERVYTPMR